MNTNMSSLTVEMYDMVANLILLKNIQDHQTQNDHTTRGNITLITNNNEVWDIIQKLCNWGYGITAKTT